MNKPELLRQIATAMEQDPNGWWRGFEWSAPGSHTCWYTPDCAEEVFRTLTKEFDIRPHPRTIRIDVEVPDPMRHHPDHGEPYWVLDLFSSGGIFMHSWDDLNSDLRAFSLGIWPTEYQALQAADAIFGALGGGK